MAVPKRKTSKARRDKRRASTWTVEAGANMECPQCHEVKLPHRVCKNCGYYDGKAVIAVEKDEKEAKAAAAADKKAAKAAAKDDKKTSKKVTKAAVVEKEEVAQAPEEEIVEQEEKTEADGE